MGLDIFLTMAEKAVPVPVRDHLAYMRHHYPYAAIYRMLRLQHGPRRMAYFLPAINTYSYCKAGTLPESAAGLKEAMLQPYIMTDAIHVDFAVTRIDTAAETLFAMAHTEREWVLDIDLRDYSSRPALCGCDEKSSCQQCWLLIECCVAACESWLGETCGLGPLLVVFSGGKGAHLWFGSPLARAMGQEERQNMVALMGRTTHEPSLVAAKKRVLECFVTRGVEARNLLSLETAASRTLSDWLLRQVKKNEYPPEAKTSRQRWDFIASNLSANRVANFVWTHFGRPVPDTSVLQSDTHLVKMPFSVHPRTRRVALPLSRATLGHVDPQTMPTVVQAASDPTRILQPAIATLEQWLSDCGY